jgi:hypothetical protein
MNILDMKRKLLPMSGYQMDGGNSGGGGQPTNSSVYQTNIPEYARPYVETMLGAGQQQIFNYEKDANGNMVPTTMKGYQPFSNDPSNYFAGFSPMQEQAFRSAANMNVAPQMGQAAGMAGMAGMAGLGTQYDPMSAYAQQFDQNAAQQYMNPYIQDVINVQQDAAQRQADIASTGRNAQAVQAGAFGGSRQAIADAEAARALAAQKGAIQAQGLNAAYTNAQQQFNADQQQRMAAQQANIGQQQFGANLGMQGLQTALGAAGQLGNIGQNIYGQNMGINQLQNQYGAQQQQAQQNILNQQIQNYATAQQYPMMQLANMNNLLRGLPMQSTTVQGYQASPNALTQLGGLGLTAAGIAGMGGVGKAKGGKVKEDKRPAGLAELALSRMAA